MPGENFPGDRIVSLVDELEGLIEEAKTPFGKNAQMKVIDADVFFNILDEIRMSYPEEWQKSRRILKEREELMASAAAQADSIIADAQQQALTIAGEQEIVRLAQQQADDIRDRAQQYERETRYAAEDYAEQVFTHLEENLKSLTGTVTRCRQQLTESASAPGRTNASLSGGAHRSAASNSASSISAYAPPCLRNAAQAIRSSGKSRSSSSTLSLCTRGARSSHSGPSSASVSSRRRLLSLSMRPSSQRSGEAMARR